MLLLRKLSSLLMVALSVVAFATPLYSLPADVGTALEGAQITPSGKVFGELDWAASDGSAGAAWAATLEHKRQPFTEPMFGENAARLGTAEGEALPTEVAVLPSDETPSQERVPEPSSLLLMGAGMLVLARVSRIKRQQTRLTRTIPMRLGIAQRS